jgi:hypothetical protein
MNVRFGSLADILDHQSRCGFTSKASVLKWERNVRFVP